MISCDFFGGLGNNLFQLATAYSIHVKYGYDIKIPRIVERGNIGDFGQETNLEISELFENNFDYSDNINLKKYNHFDILDPNHDFTFKEMPINDNITYCGYFQSDKYFLDVDIKNHFKIKKDNIKLIEEKFQHLINKKNISLHYRLAGDRVKNEMQHFHKNVSVDYYSKSLSLIDDLSDKNYNILVFSDNIKLAKELLSNLPYEFCFIENKNNILDFTMMSMCEINIIGNSTFSWWSAYMNKNKNKKIIVPETEWFGPGYKHFNLKDLFPKSWIRI